MPQDIKETAEGEVELIDGDISFGESTGQHIHDIIYARPGDYRLTPIGVGAEDYLEDEDPEALQQRISEQLAADGLTVNRVLVNDGKISVDAEYKDS